MNERQLSYENFISFYIIEYMKKQSETPTTEQREEKQQQSPQKTVIQKANQLVDSVTNLLCGQITAGHLKVPKREKPLNSYIRNEQQSMIKLEMKTIDIDEHKKMVQKFIRENKHLRKRRQVRSYQQSEKSLKVEKEIRQSKINQQNSVIEERRKEIEKRMEAKKALFREIRKSSIESNEKIKHLRRKKFLYQDKEEQFYKNVLLPKIEEENKILDKKKELRKPMNLSEIQIHGKQYDQLRMSQSRNRSITLKMIEEERMSYSPPAFVPSSYRISQKEENMKKEEQFLRKKQTEINDIRKKQYTRRLNEIRERQRTLSKSRQLEKKAKEQKEKLRSKKSRQQTKKMGNDYLKELLESKKKFLTTKKLHKVDLEIIPESPKRKIKSQYEIEIIKEERIQKIHKIKARKIDSIVHDQSLDDLSKYEKLKYETEKLDQEANYKMKEGEDIETMNQSASIMMNSIQAKLAMLAFSSTKKI